MAHLLRRQSEHESGAGGVPASDDEEERRCVAARYCFRRKAQASVACFVVLAAGKCRLGLAKWGRGERASVPNA